MGSVEDDYCIPVIDFADWTKASTRAEQYAIGKQMVDAIATGGFFYLINHGIKQELLDEVFAQSKRFFSLTHEQKNTVRRDDPLVPLGYSEPGRENASKAKDLKEMFDAKSEGVAVRYWPSESLVPGFKEHIKQFIVDMTLLTYPILRALAVGIGLEDPEAIASMFPGDNHLRLMHYPSCPAADLDGEEKTRLGAHQDFSSLTLLFQDDCGGLQVENPNKKGYFVDAPTLEGAVIVSIGLPWHRWTNDRIKAGRHRVTLPPLEGKEGVTRERFSLPFFADTSPDTVLKTFPQFIDDAHPPKYEPATFQQLQDEFFKDAYDAK